MFKVLALSLFVISFSSTAMTSAKASELLISESRNLKINIYKSVPVYGAYCDNRRIAGRYSTQDGIAGVLYPMCSKNRPSDIGYYRFEDGRGSERCKGRMAVEHTEDRVSGRHIASRWAVDGTVPGYRCKAVGQTFDLKMGS